MIMGADDGIDIGYDAEIINTGSIKGGDDGIDAMSGAVISTTGSIDGGDYGIEMRSGIVANLGEGTITGVYAGIYVDDDFFFKPCFDCSEPPFANEANNVPAEDDFPFLPFGAFIYNEGTISASMAGLEDEGPVEVNGPPQEFLDFGAVGIEMSTGAVWNKGTISGEEAGIYVYDRPPFPIGLPVACVDCGDPIINGDIVNNDLDAFSTDLTEDSFNSLFASLDDFSVDSLNEVPLAFGTVIVNDGLISASHDEDFYGGINGITLPYGLVMNSGEITGDDAGIQIRGQDFFAPCFQCGFPIMTVQGELNGQFPLQVPETAVAFGFQAPTAILNDGTISGDKAIVVANPEQMMFEMDPITTNQPTEVDDIIFPPFLNPSVLVANNGTLSGTSGTAVEFGNGNDAFIWMSGSRVDGNVLFNEGYDQLSVLGTEVLSETRFENLERVYIDDGVAAIFLVDDDGETPETTKGSPSGLFSFDQILAEEDVTTFSGILYTANPATLNASGGMVNGLANDLAKRMLNSSGDSGSGVQTTQGAAGSGTNWWVMANGKFEEDRGQGFTQNSRTVTVGRNLGNFEVFFGLENAEANLTASTETVDQQTVYAGALGRYALSETIDLKGLFILGKTDTTFTTPGGSLQTDGMFASISARAEAALGDFTFGGYAGASRMKNDATGIGALSFSSQTSNATFAGFDLRGPDVAIGNGATLSPIIGFGVLNGSADAVVMSAGGVSTTIAGTSSTQHLFSAGFDLEYGNMNGLFRVRGEGGSNFTVDLGVRVNF